VIKMVNKTCNKCNLDKPLNEFHKKKQRKEGYSNTCKLCTSIELWGNRSKIAKKEHANMVKLEYTNKLYMKEFNAQLTKALMFKRHNPEAAIEIMKYIGINKVNIEMIILPGD
jgi:hypothetical protein